MKKIIILTAIPLVLIVGFFIYLGTCWYTQTDLAGASALKNEINNLIQEKNANELSKVSLDQQTVDFFMKLPTQTKSGDPTDSQGMYTDGTLYYVVKVEDTTLYCYMEKIPLEGSLFTHAKWKLKNVGLNQKRS